ncbi:MAG TPA: hypothetical protein VG937_28955 [Polyangiaceae bacterium]|nr:hypothetical protein [Polyangiaceae bacterium]
MLPRLALYCSCLLLSLGCGSALSSAVEDFESGRHAQASRRFRTLEADLPELSFDERVHYALYRGLTDLALGDAESADRWLSQVKREVDVQPLTLNHAERGRLLSAWRSLGRMPGE